jgi:hypothetical protein
MDAPDVPLPDEDTGVVDGLGETALEDLGLQPALQEILDLEGKHVIETHAGLVEDTDTDETADEGVTLEETLGVLVVELEELTGGTTDLGEGEGDTPDLALVAKTVFTGELGWGVGWVLGGRDMKMRTHLQLGIEASRLERSTRDLVSIGFSSHETIGGKGS